MKNMTPEQKKILFPDNMVLLGYRGSVAHNMYDPNSIDDIDLMGVYMAPVDHYIGINRTRQTLEKFVDQWDVVNYEFMKFVDLLLKSNPNVLSLLWIKDDHYIKKDTYGAMLIENRDLFVSKEVYKTHVGYALSQMKRMTSNNKYFGYMGSKRKKIVDAFGYDSKMASHTIRLLRMGIEFLADGKMTVSRDEDRGELLDIKLGKWSKASVIEEANRLLVVAEEAVKKSALPDEQNVVEINKLVSSIMFDYIYQKFYWIN